MADASSKNTVMKGTGPSGLTVTIAPHLLAQNQLNYPTPPSFEDAEMILSKIRIGHHLSTDRNEDMEVDIITVDNEPLSFELDEHMDYYTEEIVAAGSVPDNTQQYIGPSELLVGSLDDDVACEDYL